SLPRNFFFGETLFGHQRRPVAVSHARAAWKQGIMIADIGIGMNADGGKVKFTPGGALIQGLDVLENVLEPKALRRDQSLGQSVKHERIVRVGRMSERQGAVLHPDENTVSTPLVTASITMKNMNGTPTAKQPRFPALGKDLLRDYNILLSKSLQHEFYLPT